MKILVFGDIVGRVGREAIKRSLPELKGQYSPDLTIANAENLAHGKGVTADSLRELLNAGIDFCTSGNHIWDRKEYYDILADPELKDKLIRPANYPAGVPGEGAKFLTIGTKNVLVVNLLGRVMMNVHSDDPFRTFDSIVKEYAPRRPQVVLVDFHAEATSEKAAFGWHADGRATAIWGTHTHVPTADARVLPGGTAFITDLGMCGYADGIIGVERVPVMNHFLTQLPLQIDTPDEGPALVSGAIIEESGGQARLIETFQRQLII